MRNGDIFSVVAIVHPHLPSSVAVSGAAVLRIGHYDVAGIVVTLSSKKSFCDACRGLGRQMLNHHAVIEPSHRGAHSLSSDAGGSDPTAWEDCQNSRGTPYPTESSVAG